jgi:nucleoside-diphosphate-sugar epimerase
MKYLVTGGTGFLGKNIVQYLQGLGHEVWVATRDPQNDHQLKADFEKGILAWGDNIALTGFDYVIHAAGKAHIVPKTETEKQLFFDINEAGTRLLLEKLEQMTVMPAGLVFISSVSVYGRQTGENITENAPLLASDPYGKSKINAEKLVHEWGKKNKIVTAIIRLPLVVGKNAPGNLESMMNGIKSSRYLRIGKGTAKKSMVWAEDVCKVIPQLVTHNGIYNLTDGEHPSFAELEDAITNALNLKGVKKIPLIIAKIAGSAGTLAEIITGRKMPINNRLLGKIINPLTFSDVKARRELHWNPDPVLKHIKEIVI